MVSKIECEKYKTKRTWTEATLARHLNLQGRARGGQPIFKWYFVGPIGRFLALVNNGIYLRAQ